MNTCNICPWPLGACFGDWVAPRMYSGSFLASASFTISSTMERGSSTGASSVLPRCWLYCRHQASGSPVLPLAAAPMPSHQSRMLSGLRRSQTPSSLWTWGVGGANINPCFFFCLTTEPGSNCIRAQQLGRRPETKLLSSVYQSSAFVSFYIQKKKRRKKLLPPPVKSNKLCAVLESTTATECLRACKRDITDLFHKGDDPLRFDDTQLFTLQGWVCTHSQPSTVLGHKLPHLHIHMTHISVTDQFLWDSGFSLWRQHTHTQHTLSLFLSFFLFFSFQYWCWTDHMFYCLIY